MAVQADGKIVLGGDFTMVNGTPRNRIARLNADGSLESTATFNPGTGVNGIVSSVAVQADGKVVLGGVFTTVNGTARSRIARLNPNGSLESTVTFNQGTGANNTVFSVAMQADGKIVLGGSFSTVNGTARNRIARLANDPAPQTASAPDATQVLWSRSGSAPEVGQVTFELSTDGGTNWTPLGAGTRIGTTANWQRTGLSLPASGRLRARGRTTGGYYNGSSGLVETVGAFTFDTTTLAPVLTTPASNVVTNTPMSIAFTLPEAALPGSVKLRFGLARSRELTLAGVHESAGAHAFTFQTANPTSGGDIASGGPVPDGVYLVTVAYRDALGNAEEVSAPEVIVVVDTTPPVLTLPGAPLRATATGLAGVAVSFTVPVADAREPASVATTVPPSGSVFPLGETRVVVTATDWVGNVATGEFSVLVTLERAVHTRAWSERGLVAHVGEPLMTQVPVGAVWTGFGVPAINDAGDVVFLGKWTHPAGKGEAVFERSATTGELEIVLQRGSPPPPDSSLPPDATLKTLKDPLLAPNGNVLTPVTLAGTGISTANDAALIWSPRTGDARVVAREGEAVDGARVGKFLGISIVERGVVFTTLLHGATAANDLAVCSWDDAEGLRVLAREGWTLDEGEGLRLVPRAAAPGERTLKGFKTLVAGAGAPGQGRGMHGDGPVIGLLAKLSDGSSAVLSVDAFGEVTVYSESGFKSYGVPAWGADFAAPAFFAVPESGAKGIFQHDDATGLVEPLLQVGGEVRSLKDPVLSTDATRRAWLGATTAARAVWQKVDASDAEIVALAGTQAAEVPAGALWEGFKSLAISNRGPLLSAVLAQGAGGVDGSNDAGLWAVDGVGALRLLFREGDTVGGKVLKSFTVLKAAAGSPGVTRAFNDHGQVVWRASYTDGTSAVVVTTIP